QTMVDARAAGVAFSADPVRGLRGRTVISAVAGLGEALVSGAVDGETWEIAVDGTPLDAPVTPAVLSAEEAAEIAALAARVEDARGAPQDIEWAIGSNGTLYLLQARPITTPLRPAPTPDATLTVLDNSNIVESYPGLVSTLTFSFAAYSYDRVYRAFVRLLGLSPARIAAEASIFANLLTHHRGRVYYGLGNWYRALALLPGFALNRGFMETMMGVDEPLPAELTEAIAPAPPTGLARIAALASVGRVGLGLVWQAIRLRRTRARFMARLSEAIGTGSVANQPLGALAARYRRIEAALLDRWDAPLINDFLCMIGFGASRALLIRWVGGEVGAALHNDIMIGQGGVISAEPAARIAKMGALARECGAASALDQGMAAVSAHPALAAEIDAYLQKFGDRTTEELKLESIPLSEEPAPLLAAIGAAADRDLSPRAPRPAPDWPGLIPGRPVRRAVARTLCAWAAARVRDRENLRFERTRIFGEARRIFRAMGQELYAAGRLEDPRDVFHLTVAEVLGAAEGVAVSLDLAARAALRRDEAARFAVEPDPPRRILMRGQSLMATHSAKSTADGPSRQGTGCSAGTITAPARVITDPRTEALAPGEILVARNTDPGWIAVFANAGGIVVERGSLLSHSAIVARELGIPCAVGIPDATDWIDSGEVVTLDGATGLVVKAP
ncbi:MAG: PEP-utilizing enzyme, partial [Pseudomonadota bacterium]